MRCVVGSGRDSHSVSRVGRLQTLYCKTVCAKEAKFVKSVTSTYVKFVKSGTITMVLAQWRRWAKATPPIPWWSAGRPLRVATDCTGLAVAEVSLQTLAATLGVDIQTVFVCEIWPGSRHWLQTLGIQPILGGHAYAGLEQGGRPHHDKRQTRECHTYQHQG